MNKINFHRGTFLEKEELVRMINFQNDRHDVGAIISASGDFGFVEPDGLSRSDESSPFRVTPSSIPNSIDMVGGYIIDHEKRSYLVDQLQGFEIPIDSMYYWLKVEHEERNYEDGLVQVDSSGNVSGSVDFIGVVRGQSSGVPTCIRFVKKDGSEPLNKKVYQVVDILNNNNIILSSGVPFLQESQLRVIILGSIPMGRRFTDEQLEGLYTFQSYKLSLVPELVPDEAPPKNSYEEYYIARIRNNAGMVTVIDKRSNFWRI